MENVRPIVDTLGQCVERDLGQLTTAERLRIWRRRQLSRYSKGARSRQSTVPRSGRTMTRAEASEKLGLSEGVYAKLEIGDALLAPEERERVNLTLNAMPPPRAGELCFVARRREGIGFLMIERELGVSRPKAIEMERGGAAAMVRYWQLRGFEFPTTK